MRAHAKRRRQSWVHHESGRLPFSGLHARTRVRSIRSLENLKSA